MKYCKGKQLEGIYGNILHTILDHKNNLTILCSRQILLYLKSAQDTFWLVDWTELDTGENIFIVKEQESPEPFEYNQVEELSQNYLIPSSCFTIEDNAIINVWGYGITDYDVEQLSTIVFELGHSFVHIEASPAIEIKITKQQPTIKGELLFTTYEVE